MASWALLVGPILGAPTSWFPLYLGPAIVVELLALTTLLKRPVLFGALAGLGVGTAGLWLESLWIGAVYHYPWPMSMWGEALAMAVPVAVMTGVCGALLAMVLTSQPLPRRRSIGIGIVIVTVVAISGAVANGLHITVPKQDTATVTLGDQPSADGKRMVKADVQISPTLVRDNPRWVTILSWQGRMENDRGLLIDRLDKVGPGHYRSTQLVPVWGSWKTLLRIQDGTTLTAVPIYLPADSAIPAAEVPAQASSTKNFVLEVAILQRERNQNSPTWLYNVGSLLVLLFTLTVIAALTWGAGRINATSLAAPQKSDTRTKQPTPHPALPDWR